MGKIEQKLDQMRSNYANFWEDPQPTHFYHSWRHFCTNCANELSQIGKTKKRARSDFLVKPGNDFMATAAPVRTFTADDTEPNPPLKRTY